MKKKFCASRLFLSLFFLALFVFSVIAIFAALRGMVFTSKHSELLHISEREYIQMVDEVHKTRVENNWLDEGDGISDENLSALNAYVRTLMNGKINAYRTSVVTNASKAMLTGVSEKPVNAQNEKALNENVRLIINERDGLSDFTVQMQNELTSKLLEFTDEPIDSYLMLYRTLIFIVGGIFCIGSIYMLSKFGEFSRHYLLAFMAIVWLIPIVWLIACAFSADKGPNIRDFFPQTWTLNNFKELLYSTDDVAQYPIWFKNSFTIAICNCIVSSSFVLMVAYTMSCMRFKARKSMMNFAIILNLFPGFLTMIAIYFIMKTLNMTNNNIGLIIVYSASSGLGYLIAKGYFDTVPKSLREAAKIEGASENIVFWRIVVPLSKPIIVYTIIGAFLSPWMDFIFANIMLNKGISKDKTVAIGLYAMTNKVNINEYFGRFCAGGLLVSIPISALFVVMQKFYIEGVTGGSVKG